MFTEKNYSVVQNNITTGHNEQNCCVVYYENYERSSINKYYTIYEDILVIKYWKRTL